MDVVIFLFGAFALVAGTSKLTSAKLSWYRPARVTRFQFREPDWLRRASGILLIFYAIVSFIGIGAGWFR